jgi:hypothetical protein
LSSDDHPDALRNFERAVLPEEKIRYALRDPDKRKPFEALGFNETSDNWETLRERIVEGAPHNPANFVQATTWGEIYNVDMIIEGPAGKRAPIRTGWIYRSGENFPRLTTLYVKSTEWRRMEREDTI